ncbi:2-hydroxychromene-2-carboxylate isomerase [Terasakiella sp. A23]|uniref:2-hydroxychromene-2-carboxylate isomerase n=1 Tax=Terasakiella sp. FCG-A23 TaxID=3080561 RepID=UPI002955D525|nr:2-hydroxychromene-2-carboxylate isomerase [Terasakiella sp. A23]MDV7338527.1 2-hydroxychromene-2-carboxylate isomerase [Terasakiella sp. A23]
MTQKPIEFYFDLSSPFAYLTSKWIDDLAARYDRTVTWKPVMLGVMFKETGMKPLFHQPLRGDYGMHDFLRSARMVGLDVVIADPFPYLALAPSRGFYWLEKNAPEKAVAFAKLAFNRYFEEGVAPASAEELKLLCDHLDIDASTLIAGIREPMIKDRLKDETTRAIENGVFGAPFIRVDGEGFWGNDRKEQIDQWLKTGGW